MVIGIGNEHYDAGRIACKEGLPTDDCTVKGLNRQHWLNGWYDQFYAQKWEPRDEYSGVRIWPVPI